MTISDTELEAGLRGLRARARDIAPPPHDLAQRTRERYRAQRRTRAALAAGGLAAALVLVGVPVVASTIAADPQRGEVAGPSDRPFVPAPPSGLYAVPTRGGLADDGTWLDEVAALEWALPDPDLYGTGLTPPNAPPGTRRVAFADDVASGRIALVLGIADRQVVHAWFTGPAGASPEEMELATLPGVASPGSALALLDAPGPDAAELTLVVVAEPGDAVDLGLTPVVEADGQVRADRIDLDVEDGIANVEVEMDVPFFRVGGDVRATRENGSDRSMTMEESARLRGDAAPTEFMPLATAEDPRGLAGRSDPEAAQWSVGSMLASYGLTAEQARPTLLAAGQLGARVDRYGELYGLTHPSGATTTWLISYSPGNRSGGVTTTSYPAVPAGTPLLDQVVAVEAMAGIIVSAPTGVEAQVLGADGALLVTVPLERGAGTAPYNGRQEAASVRIVDGAGNVVAEAPMTGTGG
ncbi:hypothetical protein [Blastococcus haudaquaticus]|uniref:Uncharacterized protein n=1 Tax=Blastococcus haudaquaticus TaxID=1938745 RepID=A0A286GJP0_9ACTN|nr:hypothetical protein [Blastococcus haudaquaticus]SOD95204.1 hypothetical protein SAMN06272739_1133 [Blastococcus haudaquaticus]